VPINDKKPSIEGESLSEDKISTLLSAKRRRELLRLLKESGGESTMGDITMEIAASEHDADGNAGKRKAVYVSLHQTHVPRLVEAGVLESNEVKKTIRLTGPWQQLHAYLEFDPAIKKQGWLSRMFRPRTGRKEK